jgi:hypothetical protein
MIATDIAYVRIYFIVISDDPGATLMAGARRDTTNDPPFTFIMPGKTL